MRPVLSFLFWTFLCLSCVPMFLIALLTFTVTYPFDPNRRLLHLVSCFWAQLYFYVNPLWRLRFEGRDKLPWRGPAVLVANHQSLGDILVLFGLYRPFKWVSKASVFKVPLVGWNMVLNGYVPLVRGHKESIARMYADCERWLDRGVPVLMFPEGTRSPDGEVQAFKDGAFRLAVKKGCPVIPIVVCGTAEVLPKHGFVIRQNADCRVRVLDPVDPAPFQGSVEAMRDAVREKLIEEKRRLDADLASRPAALPGGGSSQPQPRA